MKKIIEPYQLFSDPLRYYNAMIEDIDAARNYIYIETFRVGNDQIGDRFRRALTQKAKEGVDVRLLIDGWGAGSIDQAYFAELISYGGQLRFFEKIKFNTDIFTRSHKRNHRKLLLIDDEISWIGSSNLTGYNMNWRESMLRMKSGITYTFTKLFMQDFRIYNKYIFNKAYHTRLVRYENFEILRDAPSIAVKRINQRFVKMIRAAKKTVCIETPYFLPGYFLRKAMMDAAKRGVEVKVILPKQSDVNLIDVLRNKYLGPLHKSGIRFLFYTPNNLHAKLLLVDGQSFALGSTNFDYRSFRYMYEIMLTGQEGLIAGQIKKHNEKTISETIPFDIKRWEERPLINRFFEWVLLPFRHLL
ncbi:MAG: phosphatidylserine/phosphatidylglycerophosphate/cardiolipin synthase family protein [Bacteroidales bacterium]|nr:phosphatidylserine/phosphatidylglycerophosphate/cardiolipin synthase family protein [Bacteroidales bacterium]